MYPPLYRYQSTIAKLLLERLKESLWKGEFVERRVCGKQSLCNEAFVT